jgi:hypothetical protein
MFFKAQSPEGLVGVSKIPEPIRRPDHTRMRGIVPPGVEVVGGAELPGADCVEVRAARQAAALPLFLQT